MSISYINTYMFVFDSRFWLLRMWSWKLLERHVWLTIISEEPPRHHNSCLSIFWCLLPQMMLYLVHYRALTFRTQQRRFGSDDFPSQLGDFWGQNVNFQGCNYTKLFFVKDTWPFVYPKPTVCTWNRPGPKRKGSSPNHIFSGAKMLVSGSVTSP